MISFSASKLAKFFDTELRDAKKLLIVTMPNGYELFGRFKIEVQGANFHVLDVRYNEQVKLSSLKYAVAWCILADDGKYNQSRRLHFLDLKLTSLNLDTMIHRKKLRTANTDSERILYKIKLQEDFYRKKMIVNEIETYLQNSKSLHNVKMNSKKPPIFKYK